MAVVVKKITLWRREVDNRPGTLASALEPLAGAGVDLQVVMADRYPGETQKAAVELYPVSSKKAVAGATSAGLSATPIPTLLVTGDNKAGLGHATTKALADAGINLAFLMTQVIGRKYSSVIGFENEADAAKAATVVKKAVAAKKRK